MRRPVFLLVLIVLLVIPPVGTAGDETAPADILARLEKVCLGAVPSGSLSERLSTLENLLFGRTGRGTLPERVAVLQEAILTKSGIDVPLFFRLNAIEWGLHHQVTSRPLQVKLAALENEILGHGTSGPLVARAESLSECIWPDGRPPLAQVDLIAGTLVKVELLADISSTGNKAGDAVPFAASETVYLDGFPVLPKGSTGEGRIARIEPPGNMGRDARITLVFGPVPALDGTPIPLAAGEESVEANKTESLTVRVTTAGMIVLGPAGILSGLFVHGKETVLAGGTQFYVQTAAVARCRALTREEK